jgi:hypothetical protein
MSMNFHNYSYTLQVSPEGTVARPSEFHADSETLNFENTINNFYDTIVSKHQNIKNVKELQEWVRDIDFYLSLHLPTKNPEVQNKFHEIQNNVNKLAA